MKALKLFKNIYRLVIFTIIVIINDTLSTIEESSWNFWNVIIIFQLPYGF